MKFYLLGLFLCSCVSCDCIENLSGLNNFMKFRLDNDFCGFVHA